MMLHGIFRFLMLFWRQLFRL